MRAGYAADDGVALHFKGTKLDRVVSSRERGGAFHVRRSGGQVRETALDVSYLGDARRPDQARRRQGERRSQATGQVRGPVRRQDSGARVSATKQPDQTAARTVALA